MADADLIAAIRGKPAPAAAPATAAPDYRGMVSAAAAKYSIPEEYAQRWVQKESGFDPKIVSKKGATGLTQLMPDTAQSLGVTDATDPQQNIDAGARHLAAQYAKYHDWSKAFAAYNAGGDAVDKAGGVPDYPETQDYVKAIVGDGSGDKPSADIVSAIRGEPEKGTAPIGDPSPGATSLKEPGQTLTKPQEVAFASLRINQSAPKGSETNPYGQVKEGDVPEEPGAYYVDLRGKLERVPGGDTTQADIQAALKAGDPLKAAQIARDSDKAIHDAVANRFLSGALLGGKNEAGAIIAHPIAALDGGLDNPIIQAQIKKSDAADAVQMANHPMASTAGMVGGALTGGALLSAASGGAADLPLAARLGFAGAEGGLTGGAQGFLAGNGTTAQRMPDAKEGAKLGFLLGPGGELGGDAARYVGKSILGTTLSPEAANLAVRARTEHGINLRGGQMSDSPFAKFADSVLGGTPGTGYAKSNAEQRAAFTKAVAKTFGEDADGLTPQVMDRARTRIGDVFNAVAKKTTIKDTDVVLTDLAGVIKDAQQVLPDGEVKPLLNQVQEIASAIHQDANGVRTISGDTYQALTRKDSPLSRLAHGQGNTAYYAGKIQDALLDGLQRNATKEDVVALKEARTQYARLKTVEPLAEKAGPEGQISPALLQGRMQATYHNLAYDGGGPLGELAKIGQRFLKEPPNSGTADRARIMGLITGGGIAGGTGTALWAAQHPEEAVKLGLGTGAAVLTGLALGKGGAMALDNPVVRSLLTRSANGAPQVVRKPLLLSAPSAAMLANPIVAGRQNAPAR